MDKRLDQLHRGRGQLIERIGSRRAVLASQLAPLQKFVAAGDQAVGWIDGLTRYLRQRPLPVLVAAAALVLLKPKAAWRLANRGLSGVHGVHGVLGESSATTFRKRRGCGGFEPLTQSVGGKKGVSTVLSIL